MIWARIAVVPPVHIGALLHSVENALPFGNAVDSTLVVAVTSPDERVAVMKALKRGLNSVRCGGTCGE